MRFALETFPAWMLRPFILSFVTTYLSPEPIMFREGAILVNREGRRFTDEHDKPNFAFGNQPEKQAYIVFDNAVAKKFSNKSESGSVGKGCSIQCKSWWRPEQ